MARLLEAYIKTLSAGGRDVLSAPFEPDAWLVYSPTAFTGRVAVWPGTSVPTAGGLRLIAGSSIRVPGRGPQLALYNGDAAAVDLEVWALAGLPAQIAAVAGGGSGVTDHGLLTGLADNDHSQYVIPGVCDGRLTLESGVPVSTIDQLAKTTLYFTPCMGNRVALYDGAKWGIHTLAEISLAVPVSVNTNYDIFIYDNAGTLTLEAVAWTNDSTRATGLAKQDGVYVKSGATTRRYLGTIRTTGVSGQTEDSTARRLLWNNYHRRPRLLRAVDTTDSWTYTTATWRAANNNTTPGVGRVEVVVGLNEDLARADIINRTYNATNNVVVAGGFGIDSTSVNSSQILLGVAVLGVHVVISSQYFGYIGLGYHYLQRLEISDAFGTTTWYGDQNLTYQQSGMTVEMEM